MEQDIALHAMSDDDLLLQLTALLRQSRHAESDLVAHIGEVDARKLYAREAAPSMFAYCTEVLHLSEAEAYLRITAARAARKHPVLLAMLADGRLHLSGIAKIVPYLTSENAEELLRRSAHRSKRQIEELVAELAPRPDVPAVIRRLPGPGRRETAIPPFPARGAAAASQGVALSLVLRPDGVATPRPAAQTPVLEPLAPGRHKVQFTASSRLREKLERLQALMRSQVPDGDLATILEVAVSEKLDRLEARRFGRTRHPRKALCETETAPRSRHVPAAVRRAVSERDGTGCGYVDERGRHCSERHRVELHHRYPFGRGGDHSPPNVGLLCSLCRARHKPHYAESRIMPTRWIESAKDTVVSEARSA